MESAIVAAQELFWSTLVLPNQAYFFFSYEEMEKKKKACCVKY